VSVWVCGEALIDVLEGGAVLGGGPANTAKALARLGRSVEFIGGISTDHYGAQISQELRDAGVGLKYALVSEKPTSTAKVTLDKMGRASYLFTIDKTATFDFNQEWLPDPFRRSPQILHIGSLATIVEPGSCSLYEWAMRVAEIAPVIFDPNVRTSYLSDRPRFVASAERWISISTLVKASDDDLVWLYPDLGLVDVAKRWIHAGVEIVVITRGEKGLMAVTSEEIIEVPGVTVEVVDTVGAGDTVGAVLVDALLEHGIVNLRGELLREALNCAALAAAITCSRAGAQPPTKSEIQTKEENRA
jgi:fructokinase